MLETQDWTDDWRIGLNTSRETAVAHELIRIFSDFWQAQDLDRKSNRTQRLYENALHALGGYLVEKSVSDDDDMTVAELLATHITPDDGPLIFHDHEGWQSEVDGVCRKLYKYLNQ